MPDFIIVESPHDGVATITLNRPDKKNALSIALRDEISDALAALAADASTKCPQNAAKELPEIYRLPQCIPLT